MEELSKLMSRLPHDWDAIQKALETGQYVSDQLAKIADAWISEFCVAEISRFQYAHNRDPLSSELHSLDVYRFFELLLAHGYDPNQTADDDCAMVSMRLMDCQFIAADTIRLLLEHGADPNLWVGDETLFDAVDFDVIEMIIDPSSEQYRSLVHVWLTLIGYGGRNAIGPESPVQMRNGHLLSEFKRHERFGFRFEKTDAVKEGWIMHIFDIATVEETAVL